MKSSDEHRLRVRVERLERNQRRLASYMLLFYKLLNPLDIDTLREIAGIDPPTDEIE